MSYISIAFTLKIMYIVQIQFLSIRNFNETLLSQ